MGLPLQLFGKVTGAPLNIAAQMSDFPRALSLARILHYSSWTF
jgi:hypothetical protein